MEVGFKKKVTDQINRLNEIRVKNGRILRLKKSALDWHRKKTGGTS